jgi:hypothetical protein
MKTSINFWSYPTQFFLEREMFPTKDTAKIKTRILYLITSFFNRAVYEMWKNTVQPDWPQTTIWRTRAACWITKATHTHTHTHTHTLWKYAILHFPQQQCLQERVSVLRYTYIACFVIWTKSKTNFKNEFIWYSTLFTTCRKRDVLTTAQRIENTDKINRREYRSGLWGKGAVRGTAPDKRLFYCISSWTCLTITTTKDTLRRNQSATNARWAQSACCKLLR